MELNKKKWKVQEDLFCVMSYIIMIITMVLKIVDLKTNITEFILTYTYIITAGVWVALNGIMTREKNIDKWLKILEAFNYSLSTNGTMSLLIFYVLVLGSAPIYILALIVLASIVVAIWSARNKNIKGEVEEQKKQTSLNFEKLTPTDKVDLGIYDEAIEFAFSDNEVQNIAISGSYSSGKSSLLASYKKTHKDKKFIHVSLSYFEKQDDDEKNHIKLEGKILNQLLHQIKTDKIPMTNFRVKNTIKTSEITKNAIQVVTFILIVLYFSFFKEWVKFVQEIKSISLEWTISLEFKFVIGIVAIYFIYKFMWYIIQYQKNKNIIKKLSIKGNEIELFEEKDASYFDKYLNEVLYLFENVDVDAIVFEDIDRFNNIGIFERLREINGLVNIKRMNNSGNSRPLRFFYLLRDDIFTTKDRTKFFDYIIPVVPVIDGSNSYNKFIQILGQNEELNSLDSKFLQGVSLFIDDMRLLKNICNEFMIYYHRLNVTELDSNKMLAIITYKNIFPRDFNDLQVNKGYIYTLFAKKQDFIKNGIQDIDKKIKDIDQDLKKIQEENLCSAQEIATVFARKYHRYSAIYNESDLVDWIEHNGEKTELEEFHDRLRIMELKNNDKTEGLIKEKKGLQIEKQEMLEKHLNQLITKDTEEKIFSVTDKDAIGRENYFEEVKGNDYYSLLKYLIWNGYIDETYSDYMTYFYEGDIKKEDKMFLRSIAEHRAKDYGYSLENVEKVANSLRIIDFDEEECLNYDLFEYLLKEDSYMKAKEKVIKQIQKNKNYDFLSNFILEKPTAIENAAINICRFWPENFEEFFDIDDIESDFMLIWAITILCCVEEENIIAVNKNNKLSSFISKITIQIDIDDEWIKNFIKNAVAINIKFIDLEKYDKENKLFSYIIDNDLYEISIKNINHILKEWCGESSEREMKNKNFTIVRRYQDSSLYKYIRANMQIYAESFLKTTEVIEDDNDAVVEFLTDDNIAENQKHQYIEKLKIPITLIRDIKNDAAWEDIIREGNLVFSEENILCYFEKKGLTQDLIEYINAGEKQIDFSAVEDCTEKKQFFLKAIYEDKIIDEKYKQIVSTIGYHYPMFNIVGVSNQKMEILIQFKVILMEESTLNFIRDNYPDKMKKYIEINVDEYIKISEKIKVSESDIQLILEMLLDNIITEDKVVELFNNVQGEIRLNEIVYPDSIMKCIIEHHLCVYDLNFLFEKYESFTETIQKAIVRIGLKNVYRISDGEFTICKKLIIDLLEQENIVEEQKICLMVFIIENYDKQDISKFLELIGKEEFVKLFDPRSRPKIKVSNENEQLLYAFLEQNYIEEFSLDKNKKYYHYKRAKRKNKNLRSCST